MPARIRFAITTLAIVVPLSCSGDPSGSEAARCTPATANFQATVTSGPTVVIDWEPRCSISALTIRPGGWFDYADWRVMWGITTDGNGITPPITYGNAPSNAVPETEAQELVPGGTYTVYLVRDFADVSVCTPPFAFDTSCHVAYHTFVK
jgi:hypothetical protein